ncbi:hypothetical protein AVEN_39382-1 [Araneus ventricosus]|uniref:Uncharacterized protein n=1 Tax=Araneus ventricosus TaxID=182803 RepID=A0A4Y2CVC9_ARAVE|nr:hypothetical protein AVEN_39382-1 [Araneus ventricosus]
MRVIPIPERKYHVILEFEESPDPPQRMTSPSGLTVVAPDVYPSSRDQMHLFSWLRESHVAAVGMLLGNVEKMSEYTGSVNNSDINENFRLEFFFNFPNLYLRDKLLQEKLG